MPQGELGGGDILLERLAHERMDEAQGLAREQDLHLRERVRRRRACVQLQAGERRGMAQGDVVAQHHHRPRQRARVLAQPPHAHAQGANDGVGHERHGPARELRARELALVAQRTQQLVQEEGVPARGLEARLDDLGVGALAELASRELGNRVASERGQRLDPHGRLARDLVEHGGGLLDPAPRGHHQGQRQLLEPVQQVEDELE